MKKPRSKCPQCGKQTLRKATQREVNLAFEDWRDAGSKEDERQDWGELRVCTNCGYQEG